MNLFEKIFNYQIMSRLGEAGAFAITSQERSWLKAMLNHPASAEAFSLETLAKLAAALRDEADFELAEHVAEKAASVECQAYHPLLRPLRRIIAAQQGIRVSYRLKHGGMQPAQSGFPYKLEYSMVKREWYLLWYNPRRRMLMSTRLRNIAEVDMEPVPAGMAGIWLSRIAAVLDSRKEHAVIEVVRMYNRELSRIMYAFSCFEKEVEYADEEDTYRIRLTFLGDECEYVLSKIRFLGKRVRIVEGVKLQRRMRESAAKALARYGIAAEESEAGSSHND
ncbi:WYL domain-containing protein [Paenibacillus thiaminolyticus]|uniref:WYL domain-containing protein n=1 Tax=Paenibacillus thiaminolyticus TaxID=49283 RepID=UPI002351005F|nr:WYL domain-containing protein [Paenibacillus thiaminolyticus]WCR30010.1 WYL domain-containing protein [Paenibacillus thiaminolyticus]